MACKDEHSCMQLQDCITKGANKVFQILFVIIVFLPIFSSPAFLLCALCSIIAKSVVN